MKVQIHSVGDYQVALRDTGGPGIPMVFLHGFMATHQVWDPLIQQFQSDYRCIAIDLLGFGQSSQPAITYDLVTEVQFVEAVRQFFQLESWIVLGHSFGGWVAAAYGIKHPQRVQRLVLLAPAGIRDDRFAGRYRWLMPLLWETPLIDGLLHLGTGLAHRFGMGPQWDYLTWIRAQLQAQPVARQFLQARQHPEAAVDTVEQSLALLTMPSLIVAAAQDDTIPLWHCQTYEAGIPNAHLCILPATPHALTHAAWLQVVPLLRQWLAQLLSD